MLTILHIDNKNDRLEQIKNYLESKFEELNIYVAKTHSSVAELVNSTNVDIVLLNLLIEQENSLDILEVLKHEELTMYLPIIVLTDKSIDSQIHIHALKKGADMFLTAPLEAEEIYRAIVLLLKAENDKSRLRNNIRQTIKELVICDERFIKLSETIPYGVVECDEHGKIIFVNRAYETMLNQTKNEIIGRSLTELHVDKDKSNGLNHIFDTFQKPTEILAQNITKNGEIFDVKLTWDYLIGHNKKVSGYIFIITDITHQRQAYEALEFERYLLQQLMDNIPDTIYFKDSASRFIRINKAQAKAIGIENPNEAIGKTDFEYFNKEHAMIAYADEQKLIKTGNPVIAKEEKLRRKDGEFYWVTATKIPLRDKDNNNTGVVGISRDITKQKEVEELLIKAKRNAEESENLKGAFLANVSHEIRTPLNAIIGFSSILDNQDITPEKRSKYLEYIRTSGKNLLTLIEDILDFAKIEAGQVKIVKKEFDVNALLYELVDFYNTEKVKQGHENIGIQITIQKDALPFVIITDPLRLKQILSNLIGNALKFIDEGYIEFGYTQTNNEQLSQLKFYVKDTGLGIPPDKVNTIFNRFDQVEGTQKRNPSGTGLGLAICKSLVELLGGKIWVESIVEQGSTFYFTLPAVGTEAPQIVVKQGLHTAPPNIDDKIDWKGKTILVAEDEAMNYRLLEVILRKTQVNLIWAKDGQQAVDHCRNNKDINLILMDTKRLDKSGSSISEYRLLPNRHLPWQAKEKKVLKPVVTTISQNHIAQTKHYK